MNIGRLEFKSSLRVLNTRIPFASMRFGAMHVLRFLGLACAAAYLTACGMYGAGYPKPEYGYTARVDDPVFYLESGFGTATNFKAKVNPTDDEEGCRSAERVAYMQRADSYYRSADLPGPWTISAPANEPILIAGQWSRYSTSTYDYLSRSKVVYLGNSCPWTAKIVTPVAGAKYKVQLYGPTPMTCTLTITSMDGSPAETRDAPNCVKPRD